MNDDEILKIVLTNLINMLTERGELKKENLDKNIKKIIGDITEEKIFKIKSDTSNSVYNIMIVNGKISTVNKIIGFDSFISSTNNQNRIFIGNNISQKAFKQFLEKKNSEVFFEKDLMIDIIKHKYQPKFKLLTEEEKEQKLKDYNIENKFESKMLSTDAVARYFNAKPGDIFRIKRPSTFSGESFHYRLVVDSPISVIFE
jgi:DNA-directed RNA polymerase subunit H (RpoH/RPB5)